MDYKPPSPMDVLISPQILEKYQRVFGFILRLFRGVTLTSSSDVRRLISDQSNVR